MCHLDKSREPRYVIIMIRCDGNNKLLQSSNDYRAMLWSIPTCPLHGETLGMNALQRRKHAACGLRAIIRGRYGLPSVVQRDLDKISSTT